MSKLVRWFVPVSLLALTFMSIFVIQTRAHAAVSSPRPSIHYSGLYRKPSTSAMVVVP